MCIFDIVFQSTLPSQGATSVVKTMQGKNGISIHAPLTGSDLQRGRKLQTIIYFNPRSPHRERPSCPCTYPQQPYFNPRSPHRERPGWKTCNTFCISISIHAPLTGSDKTDAGGNFHAFSISIHAPLTGSDHIWCGNYGRDNIFQSTLPSQGATPTVSVVKTIQGFQSTLPSQGAT